MTEEEIRKNFPELNENQVSQLFRMFDEQMDAVVQAFDFSQRQMYNAYFDEILNDLENSVKTHTVPEGWHLVTRSYVENSIAFARQKWLDLQPRQE